MISLSGLTIHFRAFTSLFGDFLQILSQLAQVLLQVLTAAHIEELLLVGAELLLLLA